MRDIKFRGFSTEQKVWVYGCLVNNLWTLSKDKSPICEIITGEYEGDCWDDIVEDDKCIVHVDRASVGEYTGLKDKNNTERYEGDIIRRSSGYTFEEKIRSYQMGDKSCASCIGYDYHPDDEVIGNIFENPELIKT